MTDADPIEALRQLRGIEREYYDYQGEHRIVPRESLQRILRAMGHDVDDPEALAKDVEVLSERGWRRVLPPVVVMHEGRAQTLVFTVLRPLLERLSWAIRTEEGEALDGEIELSAMPIQEERQLGDLAFCRFRFELPIMLGSGYHDFRLATTKGAELGTTRLIVTPGQCFEPPPLARGGKLWGLALQLYSLRSHRNWGVGDFTDLRETIDKAAGLGIDVIGLNPLHALFPADPGLHSPYSPASRQYLNTIYIDPEAIPEFGSCVEAQKLVSSERFQQRLSELRKPTLVDYEGVGACKEQVLRMVFAHFDSEASEARKDEFNLFIKKYGEPLEKLALFYAIQAHFTVSGRPGGWQVWPREYQDAGSAGPAWFRRERDREVRYYKFLQWIAAEQLAAAEKAAAMAGMGLGVYRDLAVGVNGGGADVWADRELYVKGATIGAPPDALALSGQDWGIPPMHPDVLRERAYQPFIDLLRANMGQGGALRIDHVMALHRLWWVPGGRPSSEGTYVYYRLDELMAILALESQRHRCLVIGEDLGTVPDEIRRAMPEHGVYSYRVLYFEHDPPGRCRPPQDYPQQALITISTHDLPTLASFWSGTDIELRRSLDLYPSDEMARAAAEGRVHEREQILVALTVEGLLPDAMVGGGKTVSMTPELSVAIQAYAARSRAAVMVVQPEDWLGMDDPINVPGTSSEHPNWRRKLTVSLSRLLSKPEIVSLADRLSRERRGEG